MNIAKKVLNVFGIIIAWILSLVLVLMLIISPILQTTLSLLNPETITQVFAGALTGMATDGPSSQQKVDEVQGGELVFLSDGTTQESEGQNNGFDLSQFGLEGLLGDTQLKQEDLEAIISSDVAKEILGAYTEDLANVISGKTPASEFDAQKLKGIINDNLDEIVDILQDVSPEIAQIDKETLKADIQKAVDEFADEIVQVLPSPEEIKQQVAKDNPEMEMAFKILAEKDNIKLAIAGVVFLITVLIFLCRLPGLRGFRWLATDLFIGAGFGIVLCAGLLFGSANLEMFLGDNAQIAGMVEGLLSAFTTGMMIRTGVMLISAVALLVVYILIKKARKKKLAKKLLEAEMPAIETEEPAEPEEIAEPAETEEPAETDAVQ